MSLRGILLRARAEENSMLKVNFSETPAEERWILHGRLTDAWVHELRRCWKKNHRTDVERACVVDLNEVTFIDKSGERLLYMLARGGAQFTACGIYTKRILEQITARLGNRRSALKT
jgi:anti-anti-sigma regulatory factor